MGKRKGVLQPKSQTSPFTLLEKGRVGTRLYFSFTLTLNRAALPPPPPALGRYLKHERPRGASRSQPRRAGSGRSADPRGAQPGAAHARPTTNFRGRGTSSTRGGTTGRGSRRDSGIPPPHVRLRPAPLSHFRGAERPGFPPFASPWRPASGPAHSPRVRSGGRRKKTWAQAAKKSQRLRPGSRDILARAAEPLGAGGGGAGRGAPAARLCRRSAGERPPAGGGAAASSLLPSLPRQGPAGPAASAGKRRRGGGVRPRRPLAGGSGSASCSPRPPGR